jgi:cathepsin C
MKGIVVSLFLLLMAMCCSVEVVMADLPVHCEHHQIKGKWLVFMSELNTHAKTPLHCERLSYSEINVNQVQTFQFSSPNIVTSVNNEKKSAAVGNWTMVYDQGFEFSIDNKKFFAFNRFKRHRNSDYITSYCGETSVGWYEVHHGNNNTRSFGCYMARKLNQSKSDTVKDLPVNFKLYKNRKRYKKLNTHATFSFSSDNESENEEELFKNEHDLIQYINRVQKSWRAHPYDHFEKMTVKQMKAYGGSKIFNRNQWERSMTDSEFLPGRSRTILPYSQKMGAIGLSDNNNDPLSYSPQDEDPLPESWDWRNVSGVNYVSPPRDQGSCGSCYAMATIAAYESRIRIMTKNKEQVILSPQDVISCSHYNQKCKGGFPFLVGKHVNDFTLVPEDCFEYEASGFVPCAKKCTNPRLRVTIKGDYKYIGDFYGASTPELIMREIYKNGPVPASFLVYPDFKYYKGGVYRNVNAEKVIRKKGKVNKFEPTTHSVLLVGWGVDKETNTDYWIAKNSWGELWGLNGYFLIRRGVDEASIEAQAFAPGTPVLIYSNEKKN